jgi:1-acyl-sn-glycerol-3-phosphate acyltransferase
VAKHVVTGLYTYAQFAACLTAFLPIMAASSLRHRKDPTQREPGRWMRRLGRTTSSLQPLWSFEIEGTAPAGIDRNGFVVVANHESTADPFLLSWLPFDMRWVAKAELFKPPVVGWAMKWGGDIPLRRGEGDSVRAMMEECERSLAGGISVMMFPEGTRSKDGTLLPFKDGAFALAIRAQVPVLPIALAGTHEMRPKHSKWFGKAHARARILAPIPTRGLGTGDVAFLRERARDAIQSALPDLRTRTGSNARERLAERVSSPRTDASAAAE